MNDGLFFNTTARSDFLRFALEAASPKSEVFAAVAFYTHDELISHWLNLGCTVKLLIRLCRVTSPSAIARILDHDRVQVRYFKGPSFHTKFYILGGIGVFVGSSNLTDAGLISNQEANVLLPPDDHRFVEFAMMFEEYWNQAAVLTSEVLGDFSAVRKEADAAAAASRAFEAALDRKIPDVVFSNISRSGSSPKRSRVSMFQADFLKQYQAFLKSFAILHAAYESVGKRKLPSPASLPLRIEVDRFLNWVWEKKVDRSPSPFAGGVPGDAELVVLIEEFINSAQDDYLLELEGTIYPDMVRRLGTAEAIEQLGADDLFVALTYVYAFYHQYRFQLGGVGNMQKSFFEHNELARVKNTLSYLLHGPDAFEKRVANCVLDPTLHLRGIGPNCVTELIGWINTQGIPLLNGRSRESLRWLGFKVA